MTGKVLFRFLTITDYEIEEQFLMQQQKEGWKLRKYILPGFYFFDRCRPEDVVYRLDFGQAEKGEKSEYLQIYRDYGWEYLFDVNGFNYFRKPADSLEEELEIFSDNESRIAMVERIFRQRMIPLLCIFLGCLVPQLFIYSFNWLEKGYASAKGFTIIFFMLFAAYALLFIHCGKGIRSLKRKYRNS